MHKISDKIINFTIAIKNWRIVLIVENQTLKEIKKIQRGIFLGDALLLLPFLIEMIPLNYQLGNVLGVGDKNLTK